MKYHKLWNQEVPFNTLLGKILVSVTGEVGRDEIRFVTDDGKTYMLYHHQECCENVSIESIVGDLQDLINTPILMAEEVSNDTKHPEGWINEYDESYTWTFYKLATINGYVDIRWFGSSNGYYSESASFALLPDNKEEA